jgi:hypothetical protein
MQERQRRERCERTVAVIYTVLAIVMATLGVKAAAVR